MERFFGARRYQRGCVKHVGALGGIQEDFFGSCITTLTWEGRKSSTLQMTALYPHKGFTKYQSGHSNHWAVNLDLHTFTYILHLITTAECMAGYFSQSCRRLRPSALSRLQQQRFLPSLDRQLLTNGPFQWTRPAWSLLRNQALHKRL